MTSVSRALAMALLGLCFSALVAHAGDVVVPFPQGWTARSDVVAAASGNVAVVLQGGEGLYADGALVMQVRGAADPVYTLIPGDTYALTYSKNGRGLLVYYKPAGDCLVSFVGSDGNILWTHVLSRRVHGFSSSGTVVFDRCDNTGGAGCLLADPAGPIIRVFGSDGLVARKWDLGRVPGDVVVLGDGDQLAAVLGRSVVKVVQGPNGSTSTLWRYDLPNGEPRVSRLEVLNDDVLVLKQRSSGGVKFLSVATGEVLSELAAQDVSQGDLPVSSYAAAEFFIGKDGTKVTVFDGTVNGRLLDLTDGTLAAEDIDVTPPVGFAPVDSIRGNTIVFLKSDSVCVRTID